MPTKDNVDVKEIYLAIRNEDGTFGEPILIKPIKGTALYADSDNAGDCNKE